MSFRIALAISLLLGLGFTAQAETTNSWCQSNEIQRWFDSCIYRRANCWEYRPGGYCYGAPSAWGRCTGRRPPMLACAPAQDSVDADIELEGKIGLLRNSSELSGYAFWDQMTITVESGLRYRLPYGIHAPFSPRTSSWRVVMQIWDPEINQYVNNDMGTFHVGQKVHLKGAILPDMDYLYDIFSMRAAE